jgi:hypothetical protein
MLDVVFIALILLFTAVTLLYEWGCEELRVTDSTLDRS